jgi:excinuclease ABC subunit A
MDRLVGTKGKIDPISDGGSVRIRGAREHNLKDCFARDPVRRSCGVAGVSGSGKSSLALAFGTLYAEAPTVTNDRTGSDVAGGHKLVGLSRD